MPNVQKYFIALESLQFGQSFTDSDENLKANLNVLQKYIQNGLQIDAKIKQRTLECESENSNEAWMCTQYLIHLILTIKSNINLDSPQKEDLISLRHQNELLNAIKLASRYGVVYNLPPVLQQHQIFRSKNVENADNNKLTATLLDLGEIFSVDLIASSRTMDSVVLEMIAGIYSVNWVELQTILDMLWERTPKENYFRYLLILKSIGGLSKGLQEALHRDLMRKLVEPGGFKLLTLNTVPSMNNSAEIPNWKRYDVVARIIAHKGHSSVFYKQMIDQIFNFIEHSLDNVIESSLIPAGLVTLRKLYSLDSYHKNEIENRIKKMYKPLIDPPDVISGLVLFETREFQSFIKLQCTLFNGSSFEALPSTILAKYIPVLLSLFNLTGEYDVSNDVLTLISQCLANRKPEELKSVLNTIFDSKQNDLQMMNLHNRISLRKMEQFGHYQLQIMPSDFQNCSDLHSALVKTLKSCNNNILTYNCFVHILRIFDEIDSRKESESSDIDLLHSEEELKEFLTTKFQTRLSLISCLTDLLSFRQFHNQFHENPGDLLEFLHNALEKRHVQNTDASRTDENLPILLAVFHEFIESSNDYTKFYNVRDSLRKYVNQVNNEDLKHQIRQIVAAIEDGPRTSIIGSSEYEFARSLLSERQAHLRVYGIAQLIKLVSKRNEEALSKKHAILAMAMHTLRDEESYTYLNCIRLFVCLINTMESEVLETLSAEYLNENENIEFRLKIGEAMLKVTEELGPISYKYKDILINCFLHGCKNIVGEFRASSMSNLSTICRLHSYQVHNFFQEMILMVECTLQSDTYLPARRASVLILSQLLWGMNNLVDFQETLLPLYRLLKTIVTNDKDDKTRVHATNGLKYLNEKCKAFMFPDIKAEKEIKIFGIKDDNKEGKKKGHILEL